MITKNCRHHNLFPQPQLPPSIHHSAATTTVHTTTITTNYYYFYYYYYCNTMITNYYNTITAFTIHYPCYL